MKKPLVTDSAGWCFSVYSAKIAVKVTPTNLQHSILLGHVPLLIVGREPVVGLVDVCVALSPPSLQKVVQDQTDFHNSLF